MANNIYIGVRVARQSGSFCHYPEVQSDCYAQKVFRFVSNVDALPGTYEFNMTSNRGDYVGTYVVTMVIGNGGIITGVNTPNYIEPVWNSGGLGASVGGIGTHEVVVTYGYSNQAYYYGDKVIVTAPPDCGTIWTQQTLTDSTVFNDYEVVISQPSGSNMGVAIVSPGQYTVKGFKATGSYQGDWVGGGISPPGPQLGVVTFSFYPVSAAGNPIIPEEDKVLVPLVFINGSGVPVRVCIGEVCRDIPPGGTVPYDWPTYPGDTDIPVITYPGCSLCPPFPFPFPNPDWTPDDPGDPTNCVPKPGIICPVFHIYIPPPVTTPDPEPEPEPEPESGEGNEGNFQGCIATPCAIPYLYNFKSK